MSQREKKQLETLKKIIEDGGDINEPDSSGFPPLVLACWDGYIEVVKFLIQAGAKLDSKDTDGRTGLMQASYNGYLDIVKLLVEAGASVDQDSNHGETALMAACNQGQFELNTEIVKFLITSGASVNKEDHEGNTALIWVTDHNGSFPIVKELIKAGADVNHQNKYGVSALLNATRYGEFDSVKELIKEGANLNVQTDEGGATPLMIASKNGFNNIIEVLIEAGVDVNKTDKYYNTALIIASAEQRLQAVKLLIESNADVNYQNERGTTALLTASKHGEYNIIKELIDAAADVNLHNVDDITPLIIATKYGHTAVVELLLDSGADIHKQSSDSSTALFYACSGEHTEIVKLLLKKEYGFKPVMSMENKFLLSNAKAGKYTSKINKLIIEALSDSKPLTPWKGWSRSDIEKFDTIFDDANANNFSCCPVCLKYVERKDGCMYILDHNCSSFPGYYHKTLYEKYKNFEGIINWCTICNRICKGHNHFELGPAAGRPPSLLVSKGSPFQNDCRLSNNGGGPPEKLARFRRLREYALEVQEGIGKRDEEDVLNELVEEMWNAPLQRKRILEKIEREKTWNIPSNRFPMNVAPNSITTVPIQPITRPEPNASDPELQPVKHTPGPDALDFDEEKPLVIQFRHRKADGTINNHINEYIGVDTLENFISLSLKNFGDESFGMCWNYAGGCTARLYPEEIKEFIPEDLYNTYKEKFNTKFQMRGGKYKKTMSVSKRNKVRKTKRKMTRKAMKGGSYPSIFTEATDARCYLPRRNKTHKLMRVYTNG